MHAKHLPLTECSAARVLREHNRPRLLQSPPLQQRALAAARLWCGKLLQWISRFVFFFFFFFFFFIIITGSLLANRHERPSNGSHHFCETHRNAVSSARMRMSPHGYRCQFAGLLPAALGVGGFVLAAAVVLWNLRGRLLNKRTWWLILAMFYALALSILLFSKCENRSDFWATRIPRTSISWTT